MELIPHQQADRYDPQQRGGDIDRRCIGRFQNQLADRFFGGQRDGDAGAEREAPHDDPLGLIALRGEGVGRGRVLQQPAFAGLPARSRITAIGQRHEAGAVRNHAFETTDPAGEKIAVAGKKENDGMAGFCRHMPDNDLLAIGRGENVLLGLRKPGGGRRGTPHRRNRKQHRPLLEKENAEAAEIADRYHYREPFQDDHGWTVGVTSP